ncbi:MAG: aryl-sulfate sulfotransferase [Terracidiphilus sp.]
MQKQDKGWRVFRLSGNYGNSAMRPGFPATRKVLALLLAAGCPIALFAASGRAVAPKATAPVTTVSLNTLFFDFGNNLVNNELVATAVVVTNTGKNPLFLNPTISGNASYSIATGKSCGADLAPGKSCDEVLSYIPSKASYPGAQNAVLNMNYSNADPGDPGAVAITGVSALLRPGTVSPTNNPQVALYTMTLPFPGKMRVLFGPTTTYGLDTWYQSTDTNNGQISIFVAGMKQLTAYHMAAQVELSNGIAALDADHTFTTQAIPTKPISVAFDVKATTTPGMTPQPGIEMTNPLRALAAYDLQGNQIWTYQLPTPTEDLVDGFKMLPNGDILIVIGASPGGFIGPIEEIREINLAGDIVREISIADLNAELTSAPASCKECAGLQVVTFHHDVTPLPNGHLLVLTNLAMKLSEKTVPKLNGYKTPIAVTGDQVIDLDENWQPVWAWNEFNHLNVNRQPWSFPDWTHSNAVVYSRDDGDFLVSSRAQNWVMKVDYRNGAGTGDLVWELGEGGTFTLTGNADPILWPYAQHLPSYFSSNTSGVFSLGMMDNGDDRSYPAGSNCVPQKDLPTHCLYTTIPVYQIDEKAKTAKLLYRHKLPANLYNYFGGNAELLPNGHVEYDLCGLITPGGPTLGASSLVREETMEDNPQTVWSLQLVNENFYRAFRVPSLYPDVQW